MREENTNAIPFKSEFLSALRSLRAPGSLGRGIMQASFSLLLSLLSLFRIRNRSAVDRASLDTMSFQRHRKDANDARHFRTLYFLLRGVTFLLVRARYAKLACLQAIVSSVGGGVRHDQQKNVTASKRLPFAKRGLNYAN